MKVTFFAKTPLTKRWEKQGDENGECEHGPHAACLYADAHGLTPGEAVEVTIHYGERAERPDGNIALYAVTAVDGESAMVQWIGCREER